MSSTTLRGGASTLFPVGWTDALYHQQRAAGRARYIPELQDWQKAGYPTKVLSDDHKARMREGLQRYHERRRAEREGG